MATCCWAWIILAWLVRDHVCMCLGSEVKPGDTHATVSRRRRHARCAQLRHYDIPANQHIQQPVAVQIISRLGPQLLWRGLSHCWVLTYRTLVAFWATVTSNSLPYAVGLLSCLSLTLVYCGQTVGWIMMPLGTEVGLGTGDIVLDGHPAPHPMERGTAAPTPLFSPCLLWPNVWKDQDTAWFGGRPRPRWHCVGWEPSSPAERRTTLPPLFGPHIALTWLSVSATTELLWHLQQ